MAKVQRLVIVTWLVLPASSETSDTSDRLPFGQVSPVLGSETFGLVLEQVPLVGVGPLPPPLTPRGHLRLRPVIGVSLTSDLVESCYLVESMYVERVNWTFLLSPIGDLVPLNIYLVGGCVQINNFSVFDVGKLKITLIFLTILKNGEEKLLNGTNL